MKLQITFFFFLCAFIQGVSFSQAATYYIRTDGGTAKQCNGLEDKPYLGSGTAQPCSWNHPFEALGVKGSSLYPQNISGGDTVIIKSGSYKMGHDPSTYNNNGCSPLWPYNCYNASIPPGPDAMHPTRILGEGWDAGCSTPPELYGVEKAKYLLYIEDSANIEISCLELTDHAECSTNTNLPPDMRCPTEYPYGDYSQHGIYAYNVDTLSLNFMNIHGLQGAGIKAAEITDFSLIDSIVAYNSTGGMNLDIDATEELNQFYGTFLMKNTEVSWSGCIEQYPNVGNVLARSCVGGNRGGFGDGVGFQRQDNGVQIELDNCSFIGNVEDGFDALYVRTDPSAMVYVHDSLFMHNAGNDLKIGGNGIVENNVLVGDCNYFDGKILSIDSKYVVNCRGNATLSLTVQNNGHSVTVVNNSMSGQADSIISMSSRNGGIVSCDGSERFYTGNNIFRGGTQFQNVGKTVDSWYINYADSWVCPGFIETHTNNLFFNNKDGTNDCITSSNSTCAADPLYVLFDEAKDSYDFRLQATSPAIDRALPIKTAIGYNAAAVNTPASDYYGNSRINADIGMHETNFSTTLFPIIIKIE